MRFSIIMPVYNVEKYVEKSIRSILNQTYKNFELIVVNDGTKDNSMEIIRKIQKEDSRVKVYSKKNGGVSSARNYGLKRATGDYVCFVDSDDYIYSYFLEKINKELITQKFDLIIFGYKNKNVDFKENTLYENIVSENGKKFYKNGKKALNFKNVSIIGFSWNKCFKRSVINDNNLLFDEKLLCGEDFIFCCNFIEKCNTINVLSSVLYCYIQRNRTTLSKIIYDDMLNFDLMYSKKLKEVLLYLKNDEINTKKIVLKTLFERIKWSLNVVTMDRFASRKEKMNIINKYFLYVKSNKKNFKSCVLLTFKDEIFLLFVDLNFIKGFYFFNRLVNMRNLA